MLTKRLSLINLASPCRLIPYTRKNWSGCRKLLKQEWTMLCCTPVNSIVNNVVEPTSCNSIDGSTTLSQQVATVLIWFNNIVSTSCNSIDMVQQHCLNKLQRYWWFSNIVNNAVHGVQHNIVHSCFKQLATTCWFLRVYINSPLPFLARFRELPSSGF